MANSKMIASRNPKVIMKCRCGGRIENYATELGTCTRCHNDFYIWRTGGEVQMRMLEDHRRDLT